MVHRADDDRGGSQQDGELREDEAQDEPPSGRTAATAIRDGLQNRGLGCDDLDETGYSFYFSCEVDQASFHVEIGYLDDADGRQWLACPEPRKPGPFGRGDPGRS